MKLAMPGAMTLIVGFCLNASLLAQAPPLSQTGSGTTLRLTTPHWVWKRDIQPDSGNGPRDSKALAFDYQFSVQDPKLQAPIGGQAVFGDEPTATDPLGQPVLLVTGSPQAQGGSVAFAADPSWPTMTVNIEMAVPAAPPEADGSYQQALTFADVPLPDGPGQALTLHQTVTTGRATQIILEKIALQPPRPTGEPITPHKRPNEADDGATILTFHVLTPPLRVFQMSMYLNGGSVQDDQGRALFLAPRPPDTGAYSSSGPRSIGGAPTWDNPIVEMRVPGLPAAGAKTLAFSLRVEEYSPQLKQAKWFRQFHFVLHPAQAPFQTDPLVKPLAVADAPGCRVALESWPILPVYRYAFARLWTQDRDPSPVPRGLTRQWVALRLRTRMDAGQWITYEGPPTNYEVPVESYSWKADGAPIRRNEQGIELHLVDWTPSVRRITLEATVQQVLRQERALTFAHVPLPRPGQTLHPNMVVSVAPGGQLVLTTISWFTLRHPLPEQRSAGNGLAVVFALRRHGVPIAIDDLDALSAVDARKRLLPVGDDTNFGTGAYYDMVSGEPEDSGGFTLIYHPPHPDAGTITLRVRLNAPFPTGRVHTVLFRDISVSPVK